MFHRLKNVENFPVCIRFDLESHPLLPNSRLNRLLIRLVVDIASESPNSLLKVWIYFRPDSLHFSLFGCR